MQPLPNFDGFAAGIASFAMLAAGIAAVGFMVNWLADFFTTQKNSIEEWEK